MIITYYIVRQGRINKNVCESLSFLIFEIKIDRKDSVDSARIYLKRGSHFDF